MKVAEQQPQVNENVIREMRQLASQGATVPQLVRTIQTRLGYKEDAVLPILWYFTAAFCLPLPLVLPLREWFVQRNDEAIDTLLRPEIARTQAKWHHISNVSSDDNGVNG
ncbi:MAG TPA: hypothetical protein VMF69_21245 [Gemmataceae bacterium]|nr:hypothetical protein [Gemmataceae bacterium]